MGLKGYTAEANSVLPGGKCVIYVVLQCACVCVCVYGIN